MSLYPKYGVYKILLEISGLKKSVVISDLSLKPMSLNPKFTVTVSHLGPRNCTMYSTLMVVNLRYLELVYYTRTGLYIKLSV